MYTVTNVHSLLCWAGVGWSRRASSTSSCITSSACTTSRYLTPPRSRNSHTQTETHHCTLYCLWRYAPRNLASSQSPFNVLKSCQSNHPTEAWTECVYWTSKGSTNGCEEGSKLLDHTCYHLRSGQARNKPAPLPPYRPHCWGSCFNTVHESS